MRADQWLPKGVHYSPEFCGCLPNLQWVILDHLRSHYRSLGPCAYSPDIDWYRITVLVGGFPRVPESPEQKVAKESHPSTWSVCRPTLFRRKREFIGRVAIPSEVANLTDRAAAIAAVRELMVEGACEHIAHIKRAQIAIDAGAYLADLGDAFDAMEGESDHERGMPLRVAMGWINHDG